MCGSGKGGQSSSSSTNTTTPPAYLNSAYQSLVGSAQATGSTPYQPYTGELVAPMNGVQGQAINQVEGAQGTENPYLGMAAGAAMTSQQNPWGATQQYSPSAIQSYSNPYQSQVVDATMANINNTNAQQQTQLQGNAISQGALGGDRAGIASAELANQQGLAANQTLAQLNNQNYTQAQGEFNTEQQSQLGANEATGWLNSQAANTYGNMGTTALNDSLLGSSALSASGNQLQQQQQAQDNSGYSQYEQAQAYPYQQQSWLDSILTGTGSVAGGTTTGTGTTTQSGANTTSQIGGGLAGIAGLFGSSSGGTSPATGIGNFFSSLKRGGIVPYHYARGGGIVPRYASGGDVNIGWIPPPLTNTAHGDFPGTYQPPSAKSSSSGSSSSGGIGSMINSVGSLLSNMAPSAGGTSFSSGIDPTTGNNNGTQSLLNSDFLSSGNVGASSSTPDVSGMSFSGNNIDTSSMGSQDWGGFLSSADSSFKRGGLVPTPRRAFGGGMGGGPFSSMGAARHSAPHVNIAKTPDLLKTPKFKNGGLVGKQRLYIGGQVLPDIVSGVGDVVGAFFGDPMAGDTAVSMGSQLDGGRTYGQGDISQIMGAATNTENSQGNGLNSAGGAGMTGASMLMNMKRGGVPHFDAGGIASGVGGLTPTAASANPISQSVYSQFSNMPQEKLQELSVRFPPSTPQGQMIQRALQQKQTMPATQQQPAQQQQSQQPQQAASQPLATPNLKSGGVPHFDAGGGLGANDLDQFVTADNGNSVPLSSLQVPQSVSQGTQGEQTTPNQGVNTPPQGGIAAQRDKSQARFDQKPDPWLALAEAGFATMAGTSRDALTNIGQGAQAGIKNYTAQKQQLADQAYKQGDIDNAANKLEQEAAFHKDTVSQDQQKIDQTKNYEDAEIKLRGQSNNVEATKPIPDGMGGFLVRDPNQPDGFRRINGMMGFGSGAGAPGSVPGAPAGTTPPAGDDYLSTLPPQTAQQVKALADGRMAFPSGFALKTPYWQNMLGAVATYDPSFDAINYNARVGTRKDFTSGKDAQSINALNTVSEHLGSLKDAYDNLDNRSVPAWNSLANFTGKQLGGNGKTNFDTVVGPVAEEMTKAYRGAGGNESDIERVIGNLNSSMSPDQAQGSFKELGNLLKGKIDALQDQYRRGMGKASGDTSFYSPQAVQAYKKIGLDLDDGKPAAAAPSFTEGQTATNPQTGEKVVFKGGAWQKQ